MADLDREGVSRGYSTGSGTPQGTAGGPSAPSAQPERPSPEPRLEALLEQMVERDNMREALKRVEKNDGAPGVDGMGTKDLRPFLQQHWARIRTELLNGTYEPQPVQRVEIPKPQGGKRPLGIPTVLDRLIEQALSQILTPIFDPEFSAGSYGFRPGRRAQDAVRAARGYIEEGFAWVVDVDLAQFFDRVNHDVLMARVARKVQDKRVLRLIRRYLEAGVTLGGVKVSTCVAGERANERPWKRKFLGFSFLPGKRVRIRLAPKTKERFTAKVREITSRTQPLAPSERIQRLNEYLGGWLGYFRLAETPSVCAEMDEWIRRRLRMCLWKQWKRRKTRYRELRRLGLRPGPARDGAGRSSSLCS